MYCQGQGQGQEQGQEQAQQRREGREGMVGGAIMVALGVVFVSQHLFSFAGFGFPWPLFILGPGLLLFGLMVAGGRGAAGLAVPASIMTVLGLLFFFQSAFDYFESWAYAWALLPTAGGVGTALAGLWSGNSRLARIGARAAAGGFTTFLAFGAFFELLIFRHGAIGGHAWTIALILVGGFLLLRGWAERHPRDPQAADEPDVDGRDHGRVFPY